MTKPTLVAIYARVSTGEQNSEAQLFALREYASRRGFSTYLANARAKGKSLGRPKDRNAELRILALRKQGLSPSGDCAP